MVSELGVDVSRKCRPERRFGPLTSKTECNVRWPKSKQAMAAFHLQNTRFMDGNMNMLVSDFPLEFGSSLCFPCLNMTSENILLSNCSADHGPYYETASVMIGMEREVGSSKPALVGLKMLETHDSTGSDEVLEAIGDLGFSGSHYSAFLIHASQTEGHTRLTYFEYTHQEHCFELLHSTQNEAGNLTTESETMWITTRAPMKTQTITCKKNEFDMKSFRSALYVYRGTQLGNVFNRISMDKDTDFFTPISKSDIYKAMLSLRIVSSVSQYGEYFEYTECGHYQWAFLVPFILCCIVLLLLGVFSMVLSTRGQKITVPYNSKSWFEEVMKKQYGERVTLSRHRPFGSFRLIRWKYDEMILVESENDQLSLEWRKQDSEDSNSKQRRDSVTVGEEVLGMQHF